MAFMDKVKDVAKKFKNSDNEQVNKVKDKISEYTGGNNDSKGDKKDNKQLKL